MGGVASLNRRRDGLGYIRAGRENSDDFQTNQVDFQWGSIDNVFDRESGVVKGGCKIEKKMMIAVKKTVEYAARIMIQWEAEEFSVDEIVGNMELSGLSSAILFK